mmetsp:Transcript_46718/g.144086  ORF Transcript_46718/g.144086 Transcript_46718/m.144086 type:complete len:472 (-) Transcript_46718:16-1431(-)
MVSSVRAPTYGSFASSCFQCRITRQCFFQSPSPEGAEVNKEYLVVAADHALAGPLVPHAHVALAVAAVAVVPVVRVPLVVAARLPDAARRVTVEAARVRRRRRRRARGGSRGLAALGGGGLVQEVPVEVEQLRRQRREVGVELVGRVARDGALEHDLAAVELGVRGARRRAQFGHVLVRAGAVLNLDHAAGARRDVRADVVDGVVGEQVDVAVDDEVELALLQRRDEVLDVDLRRGRVHHRDLPVAIGDGRQRRLEPRELRGTRLRGDVLMEGAAGAARDDGAARVPLGRVVADVHLLARRRVEDDEADVHLARELEALVVVAVRHLPAVRLGRHVLDLRLRGARVAVVVVAEGAPPLDVGGGVGEDVLEGGLPHLVGLVVDAAVVEVVARVEDEARVEVGRRLHELLRDGELVLRVPAADGHAAPVAECDEVEAARAHGDGKRREGGGDDARGNGAHGNKDGSRRERINQ